MMWERLSCFVLILGVAGSFAFPSHAQTSDLIPGGAPPAPQVIAQADISTDTFLPPTLAQKISGKTTVAELFTSLDCLFCPKAEESINRLHTETNAITFACHTDPEGTDYPFAREFCTTRQSAYNARASDGLSYTPQVILNGHIDAVGHEDDDFNFGLEKASADNVTHLSIRTSDQEDIFAVDVPSISGGKGAQIQVVTLLTPVTVPKTMRQSVTRPTPLDRIANRLIDVSAWNGLAKTMTLPVKLADNEMGFILLIAQEKGPILAAGEWDKKD